MPCRYLNKRWIIINIARSEIFNGSQRSCVSIENVTLMSHECHQSVRAWPLDLRHTQRVNKAERLFMAWYNSAILLKSSSAKSLPVWYCENRVRFHSLPVSFMAKWGCIQSCFISEWILYCIEQLSRTSKVSHKALLYGSSRQSVRCELRRNPFKHYHDDVL